MGTRYLPPELIHQIASYINLPKDRASFACISRDFQISIEHSNFHSIRINNRELSAFRHHFRFQHRRDALRNLQYTIILPGYSVYSRHLRESGATGRRNNEEFTKAIVQLLRILSLWETEKYGAGVHDDHQRLVSIASARGELTLHIDDIFTNFDQYYQEDEFQQDINIESYVMDLAEEMYKYSYLRLIPLRVKELGLWGSEGIEGEELLEAALINNETEMIERAVNGDQEVLSNIFAIPKILGITKFTMGDCLERKIEPASIVMLAARMPDLKEWTMSGIRDDEALFNFEVRQKMRMDFGKSLINFCKRAHSFINLQSFQLDLSPIQPLNHDYSIPAIHPSHPTTDFLSLGLHILSQLPNMKYLRVFNEGICSNAAICLSPIFFWPSGIHDTGLDEPTPSWPSLESLLLTLSPFIPSGAWYTTHDPSVPLPSAPDTVSNDSDAGSESNDDFSHLSVTPPLKHHRSSAMLLSYIQRRRDARLLKSTFDPWRKVLNTETFTPLILAIARFISQARLQKLRQFKFILELGKDVWSPEDHDPVGEFEPVEIDFELAFFRAGEGWDIRQNHSDFCPQWNVFECYYSDSHTPSIPDDDHLPPRSRDRLIISVRKELRWDIIEKKEEVRKALRDAVGQKGIIRVIDLPEIYPSALVTQLKESLGNPNQSEWNIARVL